MNGSMSISLDSCAVTAGHFPVEKMSGIFDLCRQLVSTNTLEVLLDSIVRQSVDILRVRYSRIMTLEADGSFYCQAAHSADQLDPYSRRGKRHISSQVQVLYQSALLRDTPLVFGQGNTLPADLRLALRMSYSDSLYLIPLQVNQESVGLLALGEDSRVNGDGALRDMQQRSAMLKEKLRLSMLIADQAASAIYRARLSYRLEESQMQTVQALAKVMESRDGYIGGHSRKVTAVAVQLARALGCEEGEVQSIRWAAMLHDIGKVGVSDEILMKKTDLSPHEWEIVRRHPENGAGIVRMASNLDYVAALIQAHHENYDGSGYPHGLQREMIPFGGRILAVADAYSAMTDDRPYRKSCSVQEAIAELIRCSGTQFDPTVIEAFINLFR